MALLDKVRDQLKGPVWINADILPGPGGMATPLDAQGFLQAVAMKAEGDVLSLGWTTGWSPNIDNPGKTCLCSGWQFFLHRHQYVLTWCILYIKSTIMMVFEGLLDEIILLILVGKWPI